MKNYQSLILILLLGLLHKSARATYVSVRLIKAKSSKCVVPPKLVFINQPSAYTIATKQWYNGETNREIFFEIETSDKNIPIETVEIEANGVIIERAIVGRTDVPFIKNGNQYKLTLVNDTTDGRHVQTAYQSPKGGPFIWIYHNWDERVSGVYLNIPYPSKLLKASLNYEVACQEMLRLMGDMSGQNQTFNGELIILNCESSAPRAHLDFPPHWHLQHWQHGHNQEYGLNWREKQYIVPHYYLDSAGYIASNKQSTHQNYKTIQQTKNEFLQGDTCIWKDVEGNQIFKQVIKNGGLELIKPNNEVWALHLDTVKNNQSVWIYKNATPIANVLVTDDGKIGKMIININYLKNEAIETTWQHQVNYDPFTGRSR